MLKLNQNSKKIIIIYIISVKDFDGTINKNKRYNKKCATSVAMSK